MTELEKIMATYPEEQIWTFLAGHLAIIWRGYRDGMVHYISENRKICVSAPLFDENGNLMYNSWSFYPKVEGPALAEIRRSLFQKRGGLW